MALRFGVAGIGYWADSVHIPGLKLQPSVEVVGAWGRNPDTLRDVSTRHGIRGFARFEDMLAAVDAVAADLAAKGLGEKQVQWRLRPKGLGLQLALSSDCCSQGETLILIQPGWRQTDLHVQGGEGSDARWQLPSSLLAGLGTPFNTLDLDGTLRLSTPGATLQWADGHWQLLGELQLDVDPMSSRLSTLDTLGRYRLILSGSTLTLSTLSGALRLNGQGQWVNSRFQFKGEALGAEGAQGAVNNLLNLLGRREGARAVISIG